MGCVVKKFMDLLAWANYLLAKLQNRRFMNFFTASSKSLTQPKMKETKEHLFFFTRYIDGFIVGLYLDT